LAAAILCASFGFPTDLWAHHGGGGGGGGGGGHHGGWGGRGGGWGGGRGFNRTIVFGGGGSPYFYGGYPFGYAAPIYPGYNPYVNVAPAALPPVGEAVNPTPTCPVPVAGDVVGNVQRALKYKGFYRGPIDGVTNATTRAAIRAYDASVGLPATGMIDARLMASLGMM